MPLNFKTISLGNSSTHTVFEAPNSLSRVFFGIYVIDVGDATFKAHISFDDPKFVNHICLTQYRMYYEFTCEDIPQGSIFVKRDSAVSGWISVIEILK